MIEDLEMKEGGLQRHAPAPNSGEGEPSQQRSQPTGSDKQISSDQQEGGGNYMENQIPSQEQLNTERDLLDEKELTGKPKGQGFCKMYGKVICLIITSLLIVAIGAAIFIFVVLGYGVVLVEAIEGPSPPEPVAVDKSCPQPYFYRMANDKCEECKTTRNQGFVKATRSCETCDEGQVYDPQVKECISCPCGGDCKTLQEDEIVRGGQCVKCPNWKKNSGDNTCIDRCPIDHRWDGKTCVKSFKNRCRFTDTYFFKEDKGSRVFDDMCKRRCTHVDLHMHTEKKEAAAEGGEQTNPYFPSGIRCRQGDDEGTFHGQNDNKYNTVTVGAQDACIYRIERQGQSLKDIDAVKYFWFVGNKYESSTFGNYKLGAETVHESFNGCLHGFVGHYHNTVDKVNDVKFQYKYDDLYRCGVDGTWNNKCNCWGKVHYGLYNNPSDDSVLSFEDMKQFNPQFATLENVNGVVDCTSTTFGVDPYAGKVKQCFCERPKWWLT